MQLLSRKSKLLTIIFFTTKNIRTFSYKSFNNKRQQYNLVYKKPYQKLLYESDICQMPKLPSPKLLNGLRSNQISKIMAFNRQINHQQVFKSHVQCLFSIISRFQPPTKGISLLLEQVYKNLIKLNSQSPSLKQQALKKTLIPIMKPNLLSKFVHISYTIEPLYNEYLKIMLTTFMIKALLFSQTSQLKKRQQYMKIEKLREQTLENDRQMIIQSQAVVSEKLQSYFQQKIKNIDQEYPSLTLRDYLESCFYILVNQYYNEEFLQQIVRKLQHYGFEDQQDLILTILKVKTLGVLHKFQHLKPVLSKKSQLFQTLYNENVKRYFDAIGDVKMLFQILNSQDQIVQTRFVITQFLSNQHFNKAKELYLNIFNQMFDTINNGSLMVEIKKIRGIFEVILAMFDYRDTKKIHNFLFKVEKAISVNPILMQRLQTLCYVCQKFGYKSDLIAEKYFETLLQIKEKLVLIKAAIPQIYQYTRQLNLARRFLTYLQIVQKGKMVHIQQGHKYASQFFDFNIWHCLADCQINAYSYFNTPSFNSFLYFTRMSINNLTGGFQEKKKIASMAQKINLRNINKKYSNILNQIQSAMKLNSVKLNHNSYWRHNHHSRMAATLKLAIHHYQYLFQRDHQQASSFLEQFLKKSINTTYFYNAFKQSLAYPGIFDMMLQLMQYSNAKSFPIQNRDLQALKILYNKNLQKLKKSQQKQLSKITHKILYTCFLDFIQHNRIYLPFNQQHYGLSGITLSLQNSIIYDSIVRFNKYKQILRMQIETYCKLIKKTNVQVLLNYLQYPYFADVYIKQKDKAAIILVNITDDIQNLILNNRQTEMIQRCELFWKKKGIPVIYIKTKIQIQQFMEQKIQDLFSKLQNQKI